MGAVGSGKSTVRYLPHRRLLSGRLRRIAMEAHESPLAWPWFAQFINLVSGANLGPCTSTVRVTDPFSLDGRRVILVDTPGFGDTARSDTDVLKVIAAFSAAS